MPPVTSPLAASALLPAGPLTDHGPVPMICPPTVTFPLKFALVPLSGPLTVVVPVRVADDKLGEDVVAIWLGAPPFAEM
jgi:hypothetical protein